MAQSTNVERKLRQLDNEMHATYDMLDGIAATQARHSNRFDELARTLAEHTRILGEHGRRLDAHDRRFDRVDARFDGIDAKLKTHDRRFDRMDSKLDTIVALLGGPAA